MVLTLNLKAVPVSMTHLLNYVFLEENRHTNNTFAYLGALEISDY